MSKGTLRQILLVTDGQSNAGADPIAIAALAKEQGITVNVIGVVNDDHVSKAGITEIEEIALAGGGVSRIVYTTELTKTVQMVTRQAMTQTIYGVVNKQLQHILGDEKEVQDLSPHKRGEVMEVVDELGETMDLHVALLIDTSASMKSKLHAVQESLIDLSISLTSRIGANQFSLYTFPGKRKDIEKRLDWTPSLNSLHSIFKKVSLGGVTPTGPALQSVIPNFMKVRQRRSVNADDEEHFFEQSSM